MCVQVHLKFSIKDFFSKCDQIRRKLRIWSHLLKKFLMEDFIFCAVTHFWAVANEVSFHCCLIYSWAIFHFYFLFHTQGNHFFNKKSDEIGKQDRNGFKNECKQQRRSCPDCSLKIENFPKYHQQILQCDYFTKICDVF